MTVATGRAIKTPSIAVRQTDMQTRPLPGDVREFLAQPSISSQMPVVFKNGARWDALSGCCKGCGKDIEQSLFTGRLARLVESAVTVDAVGVCDPCRLVTKFSYRLHDDMRVTGFTDRRWATWQARPARPFGQLPRLRAALAQWLGRLAATR